MSTTDLYHLDAARRAPYTGWVKEIITESLKLAAWGALAVTINGALLGAWAVARAGNALIRRRGRA